MKDEDRMLLREARNNLDLSQAELAERMFVSVSTVNNLETGRTKNPKPATVRMWRMALGSQQSEER